MRAARTTLGLVRTCISSGTFFTIENLAHPALWTWPPLQRLLEYASAVSAYIDVCEYGACCMKPTRIAGTLPDLLSLLVACAGAGVERLSGTVSTIRDGKQLKGWRTGFARACTPALALAVEKLTRAADARDASMRRFAGAEADRTRWNAGLCSATGVSNATDFAAPFRALPADGHREWPKQQGWDCHISWVPRREGARRPDRQPPC